MDLLESFKVIEFENPVDKIIKQIYNSIEEGTLRPGDRLPSERRLSETFGIGRTYVRDAIKKLEFYGILKTHPQSGTVVSGVDIAAMEGLMTNVIRLSDKDFFHLVETRVTMETFVAYQAALRRTHRDIDEMEQALEKYKSKVDTGQTGVKEDFRFHLSIASASQNLVIKSLMLIIIPDIINIYRKLNVCGEGRVMKSYDEHRIILDNIIRQDAPSARKAMELHLQDVFEFSKSNKTQK